MPKLLSPIMDPRHKLYKTLENLSVDPDTSPDTKMSDLNDGYTASATADSSGVTPDAIKTKLERELEAIHVEVEDMSGKLKKIHYL